jgi:serine/threonine protein kinase
MLSYNKNQDLKLKYESYDFNILLNNIDIIGTKYTILYNIKTDNKKAVYLVNNIMNDNKYILKIKLKDFVNEDEINIYKSIKNNNHPNILQIIGLYNTSNLLLIISEYIENSLTLNLCNLSYNIISDLFLQSVKGLNYLHSLNIIHGDISPYNILIKNNSATIIDFDLSKTINNNRCSKNYGTENFIAPECNNNIITYKSDIWALGKCFYVCFKDIINENMNKKKSLHNIIKKMMNNNSIDRPELNDIIEYLF